MNGTAHFWHRNTFCLLYNLKSAYCTTSCLFQAPRFPWLSVHYFSIFRKFHDCIPGSCHPRQTSCLTASPSDLVRVTRKTCFSHDRGTVVPRNWDRSRAPHSLYSSKSICGRNRYLDTESKPCSHPSEVDLETQTSLLFCKRVASIHSDCMLIASGRADTFHTCRTY